MSKNVLKMYNSSQKTDFIKASELLVQYVENILSDPANEKFRKIKLSNENLKNYVLNVPGGEDCIFEMGFYLKNDFYVLPEDAPLHTLQNIRDELKNKIVLAKSSKAPRKCSLLKNDPHLEYKVKFFNNSENSFYQRLISQFDRMIVYEDSSLQQKAKNKMDYEKLKNKSLLKLKEAKLDSSYLEEIMLLELLDWFKNDFFKWMDKPDCHVCGKPTTFFNHGTPTPEELSHEAHRIEVYKCQKCGRLERFPRYNDPGKLLETQTGRCGEWANCFVLCCRALSFDTRYILDVGDHVWAEVFSNRQQRWLHCDPCENVCDKPLLYEKGWGKKLTYVLAFSVNDLQDVSWRYSSDHKELLSRRRECREAWLVGVINELRKRRLIALDLSTSAQKNLFKRVAHELVELMSECKNTSEQLSGRTTGSLEWRTMRGEVGASSTLQSVVISPNEWEVKNNTLTLSYCCSKDLYTRSGAEAIKGWQALLFGGEKMMRKEERDWKKSYLCRKEHSDMAYVTWKIDLASCRKVLEKGAVTVHSECFENGQVQWSLSNEKGQSLNIQANQYNDISSLSGSTSVQLTAKLSRGKGENAWQHTQLFRQDLNSHEDLLSIQVYFK